MADASALAELRWRWVVGERGRFAPDREAFVVSFESWFGAHVATHMAFLAELDGTAVGMAWLAVVDRVPTPVTPRRRSGDVQAVYVDPSLRNEGIGAAVLAAVLEEAHALGLEHVTVHSSGDAITLYERMGFSQGDRWLHWEP